MFEIMIWTFRGHCGSYYNRLTTWTEFLRDRYIDDCAWCCKTGNCLLGEWLGQTSHRKVVSTSPVIRSSRNPWLGTEVGRLSSLQDVVRTARLCSKFRWDAPNSVSMSIASFLHSNWATENGSTLLLSEAPWLSQRRCPLIPCWDTMMPTISTREFTIGRAYSTMTVARSNIAYALICSSSLRRESSSLLIHIRRDDVDDGMSALHWPCFSPVHPDEGAWAAWCLRSTFRWKLSEFVHRSW